MKESNKIKSAAKPLALDLIRGHIPSILNPQSSILSLTEKLSEVSRSFSKKIALQIKKENGYEKYTYQNVYDHARSIAQSLMEMKIKKGDRVAIILENRPEWVFIYFGILFSGAIAVPFDPQSSDDDLTEMLKDSGSKIIFTSSLYQSLVMETTQSLNNIKNIVVLDEAIDQSRSKKLLSFSPFLNRSVSSLDDVKISPEDIASILYTSGTTGKPKGVMLSHKNFYSVFVGIESLHVFTQEHNVLSILPLHHSFPFMATLIVPLFSGNRVTYLSTLKREEILNCMRETDVTMLVGVPQFFYLFYQSIFNELKSMPFFIRWLLFFLMNVFYPIRKYFGINLNKILFSKIHRAFGSAFKYFVCGGAALDAQVETFLNKIGFTLIQGYGLTETSPVVTFNPIKHVKIGSAGKVIPGVEIKIMDPDEKGIGEIAIRGLNVMQGYYHHEQETKEVLKDHWFYSGDLGYVDKEGYLFLTGRKTDLIKLGTGKKILPEEIENHFSKTPSIEELCVISIESGEKEKLAAVIKPDFNYLKKIGVIDVDENIQSELRLLSEHYPDYKTIMKFIITKEPLQRTQLGKLKRHDIKETYLSELLGEKKKPQEKEMTPDELNIVSSPLYKMITEIIKNEKSLEESILLNDYLGLDLGFDSLSRIELISRLEKQFHLSISETAMADVYTVKELTVFIDRLIDEQKPEIEKELKIKDEKVLWKDILIADPKKNIKDKIDIAPNWVLKILSLSIQEGFYFFEKIFWRIKIIGSENLPKDKAFILCPNHTSYLDAFLIAGTVPRWLKTKIFFLGYSAYFDVPLIRHLIKTGRIIPLDLSKNLMDTLQACSYVLRNKKVICIFPEGGRSIDGSVQPFKKGVGILSKELNIPLIPVYIDGAFQVLPRGKFFPRFHSIKIIFGKPISSEELYQKGKEFSPQDEYAAIAKGLEMEVKELVRIEERGLRE